MFKGTCLPAKVRYGKIGPSRGGLPISNSPLDGSGRVYLHSSALKATEEAIQFRRVSDEVQRSLPEGTLHRGGHRVILTQSKGGRLGQLHGGIARHIVGIDAQGDRFVHRGLATTLHPDLLRFSR